MAGPGLAPLLRTGSAVLALAFGLREELDPCLVVAGAPRSDGAFGLLGIRPGRVSHRGVLVPASDAALAFTLWPVAVSRRELGLTGVVRGAEVALASVHLCRATITEAPRTPMLTPCTARP
jgi:hypothetical protein